MGFHAILYQLFPSQLTLSVVASELGNMGNTEKEKTARRKVLKGIVELRNTHKIPSLLIWLSDSGVSYFGTPSLKDKALNSFNCACVCTCNAQNQRSWVGCMEDDDRALVDGGATFEVGIDLVDFMEADTPIDKLPMRLDLMVYNELAKWLRPQIVRSRHEIGYKGSKIVFKDMSWCPSFWPVDICHWMEVSNFSRWKATEYTGEGDLTHVLRKAVEKRLAEKNINPDEHVKITVDKFKQKRKETWRGQHKEPQVLF